MIHTCLTLLVSQELYQPGHPSDQRRKAESHSGMQPQPRTSTRSKSEDGTIITADPAGTDHEWYFAFGANMLDEILITRRGIQPLQQQVATVPGYALCFNAMGVPYSEPGMGGLRQMDDERRDFPVHGVACLLTSKDMARVILTEGYDYMSLLLLTDAYRLMI